MICPNCGAACDEHSRFCSNCGLAFRSEAVPEKKGSHRVPVLILAAMSVVGIFIFFATRSLVASDSKTPWFEIIDNTLYFYEEYYTGPSELTVPDTVNGQTVLYLGPDCFYDCDSLTTVILPDTLVGIDYYAFDDCNRLRGIFIPENVTYIDEYAFANCGELEAIYLSPNLTYIGAGAFEGCTSLVHIFYPGQYLDWIMLYGHTMAQDIYVYCEDGNYFQGLPIP